MPKRKAKNRKTLPKKKTRRTPHQTLKDLQRGAKLLSSDDPEMMRSWLETLETSQSANRMVESVSWLFVRLLAKSAVVFPKAEHDLLQAAKEHQRLTAEFAEFVSDSLLWVRASFETGFVEQWCAWQVAFDDALKQYETKWLKETGVVPPRWTTVDQLQTIVLPWWQEQAALAGINADRIVDLGDKVVFFDSVIREKLKMLRLQAACQGEQAEAEGVEPITLATALRDYNLSRSKMRQAISNGELRDFRPPDKKKATSPILVDRAAVARLAARTAVKQKTYQQ